MPLPGDDLNDSSKFIDQAIEDIKNAAKYEDFVADSYNGIINFGDQGSTASPPAGFDPEDPADDNPGGEGGVLNTVFYSAYTGSAEVEETDENIYWSYTVPYVQATLGSNTGLISGSSFDIEVSVLWNMYTEEDDGTSNVVSTMSETNTFCEYGIIWGNTSDKGSYPFKVSSHSQLRTYNTVYDDPSLQYMAIMAQGNIGLPFFSDIDKNAGEYFTPNGLGPFSYDASMTVNYQGEIQLFKDKWRKYSSSGETEYGTFDEALNGIIKNYTEQLYNESNQDSGVFTFEKTFKNTPMIGGVSAFTASVDLGNGVATTRQTSIATSTTTSTTTTGY